MLLKMENIFKVFDNNVVLNDICFSADRGSIHALVGENGSGKTTLVHILAGIVKATSGIIYLNEKPVEISDPSHAKQLGISIVSQDNTLFENMNVAENIFLNQESMSFARTISWKETYKQTERIITALKLAVKPTDLVSSLPQFERQMIEVARAIAFKTKILILDEPTSTMNEEESRFLFRTIKYLKATGVLIIYISHRLYELDKIADHVTVIRDGMNVDTFKIREMSKESLMHMMIGKEVVDRYPKLKVNVGREVLSVKNLSVANVLSNISFSLKKGEILGICGLKGSGKKALGKALFGLQHMNGGEIVLNGQQIKINSPSDAVRYGLSYMGDHLASSVIANASIADNILVTSFLNTNKCLLIHKHIYDIVNQYIHLLKIKSKDASEKMYTLSSGNRKKIVLAKWMASDTKIFILNNPTSEIDVCSKIDVYNIINGLVKAGASIILISSEIPELLGFADRILVFSNGKIIKEVNYKEATQKDLMFATSEIIEA